MNLPSIYKQVEYIETDGHQYIDTGVLASDYPDPITYEMKCTITGRAGSGKIDYYWGASDGSNRSGYLGLSPSSYRLDLYCGAGSGSLKGYTDVPFDTKMVLKVVASATSASEATAYHDGTAFDDGSTATNGTQPDAEIWLFACNGISDTSGNRRFKGRCERFTMTAADGTVLCDFVPCYRLTDGVIGFYDHVSGEFQTNAGTGSFTLPANEGGDTGGGTGGDTGGGGTGDDTNAAEWYCIRGTTLTGIANAIRSQKGTTEKIDGEDFESEILGLSGRKLIADKPTTQGQWACLARASQMRDIKYTPKADLIADDETAVIPKDIETAGLWYSSVRGTEWGFIGYHVSLYSLLTALNNPRSIIYTKTYADYFSGDTADNGAGNVYGTNCSEYVSYALGFPYLTVTNWLPKLECFVDENGVHDSENHGGVCWNAETGATDTELLQTELRLCDVLNSSSSYGGNWGHALLVTGIRRDETGRIQEVDISDSWWPQIRVISYTWDDFVDLHFTQKGCRVYRYADLESVPFPENLNDIVYSDICTSRGDKISIRPDQDITLNVLNTDGYAGVVLFKDGVLHSTQTSTDDWELSGLTTGKYTAILYTDSDNTSTMTVADATDTNSTSFIVCNVTVSRTAIEGSLVKSTYAYTAEPVGGEYPVPVRVTIKKSNGFTIHIHSLGGAGFVGGGAAEIEIGGSYVKGDQNQATIIHVPFKTEYGFVVAEGAY